MQEHESHQTCLTESTQQGSNHPASLKYSDMLNSLKAPEHQELSSRQNRLLGQTGRRKGEQNSQIHSGLNLQEPGLLFSPDMPQDTRHTSIKPYLYGTKQVQGARVHKESSRSRRICSSLGSVSLLVMLVLELVVRQLSPKV